MNRTLLLASALGIGAGLEYAFDPERGRRRRAIARDKLAHVARVAKDGFIIAARDGVNRSIGALAELRARVADPQPEDDVLVERVRAALGRACRHPHAIHVTASEGVVSLEGRVAPDELARILRRVESVRGVGKVNSHLLATAADPVIEHVARPHALRPATRLVAITSGVACVLDAIGGRRIKPAIGGLGLFLVTRALLDPGVGKGVPLARGHYQPHSN
jgi:hypothetical protein